MTSTGLSPSDWPGWFASVAPHLWSWAGLAFVLAPPMIGGVVRAVAEWQRRTTLSTLIRDAPAGTVVFQDGGRLGPAMYVRVGCDAAPVESGSVDGGPHE